MNTTFACFDFTWMFSVKDYWYGIISAIIGALIGIWWTKRQFVIEKVELREKCVECLKSCIKFNLERLRQAKEQLDQNVVPNYPLDTAQFNHWLAQSHDSLSPELLRDLDWQRFQLDHISSKFVVVNSAIVTWAGQPRTVQQIEHQNAIIASLKLHVATVLTELPPLLGNLPDNN
jgi:hypothetical protein